MPMLSKTIHLFVIEEGDSADAIVVVFQEARPPAAFEVLIAVIFAMHALLIDSPAKL